MILRSVILDVYLSRLIKVDYISAIITELFVITIFVYTAYFNDLMSTLIIFTITYSVYMLFRLKKIKAATNFFREISTS